MTCSLWERIDRSTLDVVQKTVWFMGTKRSSPPVVTVITSKKPVVVIAELIVVTVGSVVVISGSPLSEAVQSWL